MEIIKSHVLKTVNPFFQALWDGKKDFELRLNDRDYQVGEFLFLDEYDPLKDKFSGRRVVGKVVYIMTHEDLPQGLQENWIIMDLDSIQQITYNLFF